ncbi:MAG: tRNA (cytidine(34)-2'-O)-methyltransferase [Desulfovibrionaceae bacterium]|nr:tRNA (cytidine(34)-2'-O)-methyltransferase [Desulfovibrionaceae bacterium]
MIRVVLLAPEIPPNTGSIARLCAATDTELHLIEPLGFSLDEKHLRRAGLDYWPHVKLSVWPDFTAFLAAAPCRIVPATAGNRAGLPRGEPHHRFVFTGEDALVFGSESSGLPDDLLAAYPNAVRIPIWGKVRSLNLANAATLVLYEALRQTGELEGK